MSDWNPELYNRFRAYRAEPVAMMLSRLQLGPIERIVDLGCGTGEHTVELARRSEQGRVLGIDSSPAMIERARQLRETLPPALRQRIDFQMADFRNFNADRAYTVVFSNAALQWVSDQRAILAASYRALVDKGRLAVQVPANENEVAQSTMRQMAVEPAWSRLLRGISTPSAENVLPAEEYSRLLTDIGFAGVECFYHTFQHSMSSPSEVVEFCRATSLRRFLEPLTNAQQASFIAELTNRLEEAYGTLGPLTFNFRRLFMWAHVAST